MSLLRGMQNVAPGTLVYTVTAYAVLFETADTLESGVPIAARRMLVPLYVWYADA